MADGRKLTYFCNHQDIVTKFLPEGIVDYSGAFWKVLVVDNFNSGNPRLVTSFQLTTPLFGHAQKHADNVLNFTLLSNT